MINNIPNAQPIYQASCQIVLQIMQNNNIPQPVQQVIIRSIDSAQDQNSAMTWLNNIIATLQNNGINVSQGVNSQALYQVVYGWMQRAIPEAIQVIQQQQQQMMMGGGLMGGGIIGGNGMMGGMGMPGMMGGMMGGMNNGFDYTPVDANGNTIQPSEQTIAMGGTLDPYDTAGVAQPQQNNQQQFNNGNTQVSPGGNPGRSIPDMPGAASTEAPRPEASQFSGTTVSPNMSLMGTPDSILRARDLDFLEDEGRNVDVIWSAVADTPDVSLTRAGFSPVPTIEQTKLNCVETGEQVSVTEAKPKSKIPSEILTRYQTSILYGLQIDRPGILRRDSSAWDTVTSCNLNARRAYNNPLEVLKDFYTNTPDEMLQGLFMYRIFYRQMDTIPMPASVYDDLAKKLYSLTGDPSNISWRELLMVLDGAPQVAYKAVDKYVTPKLNSYFHRFMRSEIHLSTRIAFTALENLKDIMSSTFKQRVTEDPNWSPGLTFGVKSIFTSLFEKGAVLNLESPRYLDLIRCSGISLGTAWEDPASLLTQMTRDGGDRALYLPDPDKHGIVHREDGNDALKRVIAERKDAINAAFANKTVVTQKKSIILTNMLPIGYCRSMIKQRVDRVVNPQEALFWRVLKTMVDDQKTGAQFEDYSNNEFIFNVPFKEMPSTALYEYRFAKILGEHPYELVISDQDLNGLLWQ